MSEQSPNGVNGLSTLLVASEQVTPCAISRWAGVTPRGVAPVHRLVGHGVTCSLATNNVLNPFTPFGDGSLIRMANLYANVCRAASRQEIADCYDMITMRAAALMNRRGYGIAVGNDADLVVLDCDSVDAAVRELAPVLYSFKRGRPIVTRPPAQLHRP